MKYSYQILFFLLFLVGCKNEKKSEQVKIASERQPSKAEVQSLVITRIAASQIPKSIKYYGKFKDGYIWQDIMGKNIVLRSETGIYRSNKMEHEFDDSGDAELFTYCYKLNSNESQLNWKIYDYVNDCPVDIVAEFIENTLQITDLNKNGIAEVWTMYKIVCHGDVSPVEMKIIMYEGAQKYAMRGENSVQLGIDDAGKALFEGGKYKMDLYFENGPEVFRAYAEKMWKQNL